MVSLLPKLQPWAEPASGTLQAALFGSYASVGRATAGQEQLSPNGMAAHDVGSFPHPFALLDILSQKPVAEMVLTFTILWAVVHSIFCLLEALQRRCGRAQQQRQTISLKECLLASANTTSSVHGVSSAVIGLLTWLLTNPTCVAVPTDWVVLALASSAGYLVLHTLTMVLCVAFGIKSYEPMMFIHHIFVVTWFSLGIAHNLGVWLGCTMLFNEASTIFVNRFESMMQRGLKGTRAFLINGLLLTFTFFVCRVVFIPASMYQYVVDLHMCSSNNEQEEMGVFLYAPLAGYVVLSVMNALWFYRLLRGALSQLKKAGRKGKDKAA
jgi:hypothetical protein